MPTINTVVAGTTYHKVVEPDLWIFESVAAMRAFQGPRQYAANDGAAPLAVILTFSDDCTATASVWAWADDCSNSDDGSTIVMPTDQPLDGDGDPVDGRWIRVFAAST